MANNPMTPRGNIILTAFVAVLMGGLMARATIVTRSWPLLVLAALYAFASVWTLRMQHKHRESAMLIRKAFAGPSVCSGLLATWLAYAMQHGGASLLSLLK